MEEGLSGLGPTKRKDRIGNKVNDYSMKPATQQVRQVDGGMWKGPSLRSQTEVIFIKYLKEQKALNPREKLISTRAGFIEALENAYYVGKGVR